MNSLTDLRTQLARRVCFGRPSRSRPAPAFDRVLARAGRAQWWQPTGV